MASARFVWCFSHKISFFTVKGIPSLPWDPLQAGLRDQLRSRHGILSPVLSEDSDFDSEDNLDPGISSFRIDYACRNF